MTEPDVTLTDYGLAIECAALSWLISRRRGPRPLRFWVSLFFASVGLAALLGGMVHGFFLDPGSAGHRLLWPATLLAIGVTALAAWAIGARITLRGPMARRVVMAAAVEFAGYAVVVLFISRSFAVAVLNYLPAAGFLLIVLCLAYREERTPQPLVGVAGLVLTFVASALQQAGIAVHPVYLNHNALYHLLQAIALFMIFVGVGWFAAHRTPA